MATKQHQDGEKSQDDRNPPTSNNTEQKCFKICQTISLVCVWIVMGMFMEVAGPTLKDFKLRINTTYEALSSAISGRSFGKFTGVVLGGFIVDKFGGFCHLLLAVSLSVASVTTICLPWVTSVDLLWFMYFTLGTCLGLLNIAGQRLVLVMWLEQAASPMHIVHLGYGVGGFLAPLIANPFLADMDQESNSEENKSMVTSFDNKTQTNQTIAGLEFESTIENAYIIIGITTAALSGIFYINQLLMCSKSSQQNPPEEVKEKDGVSRDKLREKKSFLEIINPSSCASGNFCFGATILVFLFMRYFFLTGVDRLVGTFLRSYAIDQLQFSKDDASYLNTSYWVCYAVGRLIIFVATKWVTVKIIIIIESVAMVIIGVCFVVFGLHYKLALWVLSICTGLFMGPMFPTGIAWGDVYIEMTGLAITWTLLGSAFGGMAYLNFTGQVYDEMGPPSFTYIFLGTAALVLVFDIIISVIGVSKSRFYRNNYDMKHSATDIGYDLSVYSQKEH